MKKHILTAIVAVFAIGASFAGTRFVDEGWYPNPDGSGTKMTEAQALLRCPGTQIDCAYHFAQGATTPNQILKRN